MRFNPKDRLDIPIAGFSDGIAHQRQLIKKRQGEKWTLLAVGSLPYLLAIYPALTILLGRSETPHYFGRYSTALFGLVVLTIVVYLAASIGVIVGNTAIQISSSLLLIMWTFPVVGNNQVSHLANVQTLLPCIRILASSELAYLSFAAHRRGWKVWGTIALMASMSFGLLTGIVDLAIPRILGSTKEVFHEGYAFREAYQLNDISENDIVLIGDSFVWGQGVSLQETFGKVLEINLRRKKFLGRVFLLGEIGIGPKRYIEIAKGITGNRRAKRVLVAFYHNDMPEKDGGIERYINIAHSIGRSSPVLRLMIELPLRRITPDVDSYHRYLVGQYDKSDSTFAERWTMLRDQLAELRAEAGKRSLLQPTFTIMPLAVDFRSYSLAQTESELRALASEVGFKVIDILPVLQATLRDGSLHRAAAGENHYDAETHRVIGEVLSSQILQ